MKQQQQGVNHRVAKGGWYFAGCGRGGTKPRPILTVTLASESSGVHPFVLLQVAFPLSASSVVENDITLAS